MQPSLRRYLPVSASQGDQLVRNPWSNQTVAEFQNWSAEELETLIQRAERSFLTYRTTSRWIRSELLSRIANAISSHSEAFAKLICEEAGKPISLARVEVNRAVGTFKWASEVVRQKGGLTLPLDGDASARAYGSARVEWFPRGPVLGISPFNFPLNLVAHKIAPALAAGCSVLLKPPPQAPGAAFLLHEIFEQCVSSLNRERAQNPTDSRDRIDPSVFQVFLATPDVTALAVQDSRLKTLSFTGSDKVGWMLQAQAAKKKVCLELGGDAAVVIHPDADLRRAAERSAWGAFAYAGQVCISVQRIFVHESFRAAFETEFLREVRSLKVGDPSLDETVVGPVIDDRAADRIDQWINEAIQKGARVLLKGTRTGRLISPWVLTGVSDQTQLSCQEVFGPVVLVESFTDSRSVLARVNHSRFGLQAGVFTQNLHLAEEAFRELEVGGVVINDIPTFRSDFMPYGGVKDSGLGREGVRFAIEEFSEAKLRVDWSAS
jgi:acyl-CoA reductase-like NAD-dependent aldehyde dehydrogenase